MGDKFLAFNPADFSDLPLYNIQAVSEASGVPPITLRSWERRYGVPEPKRDAKGYRLFSDRDIAVTRWLRDRVHEGMGISRAVNMLQVLQAGGLETSATNEFDLATLLRQLVDAIRTLDSAGINRIVADALTVASVEDVCLKLLQPALYETGDLWASGDLSVTAEHFGSNLIRSHLTQLIRISPAPMRSDVVMVGCAPGELHEIGALTLALFLRRRGFDVLYIGASVESDSLIRDAIRMAPSAICLSASSTEAARSLAETFGSLNGDFRGLLAFGGLAFNGNPELVQGVDGEYLGKNASEAVEHLEEHLRG